MAYPLKDDPLQCLENIESNESFTITAPLKSLKVELRFLRTFFLCMANRSANHNPKSKRFLSAIEGVIVEARNHLHSQYCNFAYESLEEDTDSCCSDILEKINKYKAIVRDFYTSVPPYCSKIHYASVGDEISADVIQSLIDNMSDLLHHKANLNVSVKEKIKTLEEKLRYLRSFVKFIKAECVEQDKMEDLLTHIHAVVADKAAYLSYQCWVGTIDAKGAHEMNVKLTGLLENIKARKAEVIRIYTSVLKALMISRSSSSMMLDEFVAGFVDFLLEDLIELINSKKNNLVSENKKRKEKERTKNIPVEPMKDQIDSLHKELRFLIAFFIDPPKQYDEDEYYTVTDLLPRIDDMIKEAGSIIFSARELHLALPNLLEKTRKASMDIREVLVTFPRSSNTNFPKTDEPGFINSLIQHLEELVEYKIVSDASLKHKITTLQQELVFLRDMLHSSADQCDRSTNLRRNTMQEAYRVEYTIHSLLVGDHTFWSRILDDVIDELRLIRRKAKDMMSRKKTNNVGLPALAKAPSRQNSEASNPKIQDVVVGFKVEVECLMRHLTSGGPHDVVSIVGMPGLGKTTLAKKVYNSDKITEYFDVQAWCCISQQYDKGEVLFELLSQVSEQDDHFKSMSSDDLPNKLRQSLLGKRYLIVMDDIWNANAWDDIHRAFPDDSNGSRIMLTSRLLATVLKVKPDSTPHLLQFLSKDRCWKLLQKKVFRESSCLPQLCDVGEKIAEKCGGLPLYVVLVAGMLLRTSKTKECWNQILEKLSLTMSGEANECTDVLELSYQHLPDHLKSCFLYFGAFPEDKELPVSKLTRLWIAEGFVKESDKRSMEEVAEDYLMDLIDRSLVLVAKTRSQGGVKACRIHDLLRDFCLMKAKEENFLHWVDGNSDLPSYPKDNGIDPHHSPSSGPRVYEHHRLCIYSKRNQLLAARPCSPCARTLMIFACPDWQPQQEYNVLAIIHGFKLLKVLDLGCINMGESFPSQIELLVQLRYLAVWGSMGHVPSSIENLWNLQTFLVKGTRNKIVLPMSLWDMPKLRHVHVPPFRLDKCDQDFLELENVETLSTPILRFGKETENFMRRFPRLRKLTSRFSKSRGINRLPALDFLRTLEALKVIYDGSGRDQCELHFPLNLNKLTLSKLGLPWSKMSAILRLQNLEVLKLLNGAFVGEDWDMTAEDGNIFPNLRFLKLDSLDLEHWNADSDSFPLLEHIVVRSCKKLQEIPSSIADNNNLQMIEVGRCSMQAASSARKIQDDQREDIGNELKVLIYPQLK